MSLFDNNLIKQETPIELLQLKTRKWICNRLESMTSYYFYSGPLNWPTIVPMIIQNVNNQIPEDIRRDFNELGMYYPWISGRYMGGNKIECSVFYSTNHIFNFAPQSFTNQFDKFSFTINTFIEEYVDNEHI